jgi:hypothetical protein
MKNWFYSIKGNSFLNFFVSPRLIFLSFLTIFFIAGIRGFSQITPLSFSVIPYSDPDLIAPGRGVEHWIDQIWDNNSAVQVPAGNTQGPDIYYRFTWRQFESTGAQGSYDWTKFDQKINAAIDAGKKFNFGVISMYGGNGPTVDGFALSYPDYLHAQMQSETYKDWAYSGSGWIPNWNSNYYLTAWENLLNAIAARIASQSHNGIPYSKTIGYIDIRGYGNTGEWHNWPWFESIPSGRTATVTTLKRIIDSHVRAFPNYPLVNIMGAFDGGNASQIPAEVSWYALTKTNNYGRFGWRRDNWGDPNSDKGLVNNPGSYNGVLFNTLIMNAWQFAPVVGEPLNSQSTITGFCGCMHCDLEREIRLYHATSFGNGNYPDLSQQCIRDNVIAASKATGYRLIIEGGNMSSTIATGSPFLITLNWKNAGIAPTYENWNVVYELKNSSNVTVWSGTSLFKPKHFLPQLISTPIIDNFTLPTSVPAGTYKMNLIIKDPNGYRKPLLLAITGRNADGSYTLGNVVVSTVNSLLNQSPTANAGNNIVLTLPTNSTTLTGSGTDTDGKIASYSWSKVSGPATFTLGSANAMTTTVSNLVEGTYMFRLTVTDDDGATKTDDVMVTVNAAPTGSTYTIFQPTDIPASPLNNDGQALEVGVKFRTTQAGYITGIRFYKGAGSTGTHIGHLWSRTGTKLAEAAFINESASGWQQVLFATPVAITAGTTYVASYFSSSGDYSSTNPFFTQAVVNGPLRALANGEDGPNGVYVYSVTSAFPTNNYQTSNYWVDVLLETSMLKSIVADNNGATATDDIKVTANATPNQAPTARAGNDIVVTLPANSTTLNGNPSTDPEGTISNYSWHQLSGPGTSTLSSTTAAMITVGNLQEGNYTYRLTVRDNKNATTTDTVNVTVVNDFRIYRPMALYPNPANDIVNIVLNSDSSGTVLFNIYDMQGRKVMPTVKLDKPRGFFTATINVSQLRAGDYTLEAITNKYRKMVSKFVKL